MTSAAEAADASRRSGLRLAFDKRYRAFLSAQLLATVGQRIFEVVLAVVVYETTRSTFMVGVTSAVQVLPQILLGPISGAVADRHGLLRHAIFGRLVAGAGAIGLAALLWQVPPEHPVFAPALLVFSFIVGVGLTWSAPGTLAVLPSIARPSELTAVVGLNALMPTLARTLGPAVGVALLVATGAPVSILLVGLTSLGFVLLLNVARIPPIPSSPHKDGVMGGLRFAWSNPVTRAGVITICCLAFATDAPITLGPALADAMDGGASYVGAFASAFGVGALASFLSLAPLSRRWDSQTMMRGSLGLSALGLLGVILATWPPLTVFLFGVAGFGNALAMTTSTTVIHEATPNELRGRVVSVFMMGVMVGRIIANTVNGVLADLLDVRASLGFSVAVLSAVTTVLAIKSRRSR